MRFRECNVVVAARDYGYYRVAAGAAHPQVGDANANAKLTGGLFVFARN